MRGTCPIAAPGSEASAQYKLRDLWAHTDNGTVGGMGSVSATVGGEDVVMFTLVPV